AGRGERAPARAYGTGMTIAESRSRQRRSADSVGDYLHEIGRVPLLTATDEIELARRIEVGLLAEERLSQLTSGGSAGVGAGAGAGAGASSGAGASGDDDAELGEELRWLEADGVRAMNHLICANLRLVVSVARHFTGHGLDLLDLIQEGNLGLIRAVQRFDHARGFKFSTYATWWIRQTIQRALADQARTIRLPAHQVEVLNGLTRARRRLRLRLGRDGTVEELSEASGLTVQQILGVGNHAGQPRSIDAPVWADLGNGIEHVPFGDTIWDSQALDPCDAAGYTLLLERLACHVALLPDREASVLRMRFGLGGEAPKPRREIGAHFGVSYDRVRQIELQALARLRPPLASEREPGASVRASA
ncbi:MAG TPA: sigma-70 family RNA polymerase sigma factor, partial [Cryobacterium sp.]|nr:sigma-70 family RNA polymerase sigma factor [Cryobacterium sp.]